MKLVLSFATVALALLPYASYASYLAFDSVDESVYIEDGWQGSDDGGYGWGGSWSLSAGSNAGFFFFGSSTNNGNGDDNSDGDIDISGYAWGTYAHSGDTASAVRPFSSALALGHSFEITFDNGWIDGTGGVVGFGLRNASGNNVFEFCFVQGDTNYTVNAASYAGTLPAFTDEGMTVTLTLETASTFSLSINTLNPAASFGGTGTLLNPTGGQAMTEFRFFNFNAATGPVQPQRDAYFSSIGIIIPEPTTAALMLSSLGFGSLVISRRRSRR